MKEISKTHFFCHFELFSFKVFKKGVKTLNLLIADSWHSEILLKFWTEIFGQIFNHLFFLECFE